MTLITRIFTDKTGRLLPHWNRACGWRPWPGNTRTKTYRWWHGAAIDGIARSCRGRRDRKTEISSSPSL